MGRISGHEWGLLMAASGKNYMAAVRAPTRKLNSGGARRLRSDGRRRSADESSAAKQPSRDLSARFKIEAANTDAFSASLGGGSVGGTSSALGLGVADLHSSAFPLSARLCPALSCRQRPSKLRASGPNSGPSCSQVGYDALGRPTEGLCEGVIRTTDGRGKREKHVGNARAAPGRRGRSRRRSTIVTPESLVEKRAIERWLR
jgi:hypothetical protein